jgi:hypothetical protein
LSRISTKSSGAAGCHELCVRYERATVIVATPAVASMS